VAVPKAALISACSGLHESVAAEVSVITGTSVSLVNVSVCVTGVAAFPQESVTVQVLVTVLIQPVPCSAPSVNVAVRPVVQLSVTVPVPKAASIAEADGLHPIDEDSVTVITGLVVSYIVNVRLHVLVHPFNVVVRFSVYVPQVPPASTETVCPVDEPEIVPLPVILQLYALKLAGAE
jgi:hypothetical protein